MALWLGALSGIIALLLLAFPTFLAALLLLTTILLMMPTLLLLSPFQVLFFLSVHLNLPRTFLLEGNAFQGREVPARSAMRSGPLLLPGTAESSLSGDKRTTYAQCEFFAFDPKNIRAPRALRVSSPSAPIP
jgi:hypothetical protein